MSMSELRMDKTDHQDKVVIAKTDADGPGRELGNRFGVQGFPSKLTAFDPEMGV